VNVAVADRAPTAPGVNVTVKLPDDPGAMFDRDGGVIEKSAAFVPLIATPLILSGVAPAGDVFAIVIVPFVVVETPFGEVCVTQAGGTGAVTVAVGATMHGFGNGGLRVIALSNVTEQPVVVFVKTSVGVVGPNCVPGNPPFVQATVGNVIPVVGTVELNVTGPVPTVIKLGETATGLSANVAETTASPVGPIPGLLTMNVNGLPSVNGPIALLTTDVMNGFTGK